MASGLGRRAMRIAVLAGALGSLLQALPDQSMREQLVDLAATIETEADDMAEEFEFSDEVLTSPGIRAA